MQLKLSEINNSRDVLEKFKDRQFPSKTAYKIQKNIRLLDPEWAQFEILKNDLFQKYGESKDGTGFLEIPLESRDEFYKEFQELMSQEIEIIGIMQIGLDELTFDMTPTDMLKIDWMIDIDS